MKQQIKSEWKKITWDNKQTVAKKTILVTLSAVAIGVLVAGLDAAFTSILSLFV